MPNSDLLRKLVSDTPSDKIKQLSDGLSSDPRLLAKFIDDPTGVLKEHGLETQGEVKLGNREKAMIRLFSDPEIIDLYNAGKIDKLRDVITNRYKEVTVVNPGDLRASAVADFDVAIEAEVVAVAVAVVAGVVAGVVGKESRFSIIEAENGILAAKVAALEARINLVDKLDAKISRLEQRLR
jgi:hypothetical protein